MTSIHAADKGRAVTALCARGNRLMPGFPGWDAPDYHDFLKPIIPGQPGTVTDVESHGCNPWTRYTVRFDDGSRASGLCEGEDFRFTS
jgi:hypothetical protein